MLFGIDIDIWYVIVLGMVLFCLALALVAYVVYEFTEWKKWRQVGKSYKKLHYKGEPCSKRKRKN